MITILTTKVHKTVTQDSKLRDFQYKLLHNVLDLYKMLFKFGNTGSPLCSMCNLKDEPLYLLFYECSHMNYLWNQLRCILNLNLDL